MKLADQKLRDDMMFFYGNLDAMSWATATNNPIPYDMVEHMKAQYESILKRIFEDFNDE
jgi:hypothetical protein